MKVDDFAKALNIPVQEMIAIGEKQVLDPNSTIYKSLKLEVAKKTAAVKALRDVDEKKIKRHRIYVQHVVSSSDRYEFVSTFPSWDFKFVNSHQVSAPKARAIHVIATEYMLGKLTAQRGTIIALGTDTRSVIMRGRHWVHTCIMGHELSAQYEFLQQDRSIVAMVNASQTRGRDPGLASKYTRGEARLHCTTPATCTHESRAGLALLTKIDTNFRQLAMFMQQHKMDVLYFAVPGSKHMELCTSGSFPEHNAFVQPTDDGGYVDLIYSGDAQLTQRFKHLNYMELVARNEVRMFDSVFRKEYDNSFLGMRVYKITRFKNLGLEPASSVYRSWLEPKYRDHYMVFAPVLSYDGHYSNPDNWSLQSFPVEKALVDKIHDAAMRAQGEKDLLGFISRKLSSSVKNVVVMNQIMRKNDANVVTTFDLLALVIFCSVLMQKFMAGKAMNTIAPQVREFVQLNKRGFGGLLLSYIFVLYRKGFSFASKALSYLRSSYYGTDGRSDLPMPFFTLQSGFVEYSDDSGSNPRFLGWNHGHENDPTHGFNPGLPGVEYADALGRYLPTQEAKDATASLVTFTPDTWDLIAGTAGFDARGKVSFAEKDAGWDWFSSVVDAATAVVGAMSEENPNISAQHLGGLYEPNTQTSEIRVMDKEIEPRPQGNTESITEVVNKVVNDNYILSKTMPVLYSTQVFSSDELPAITPGGRSDAPTVDLADALGMLFPGSLLMNTQFFESDKLYGEMDENIRGNTLKIDLSKLVPLKPEAFYLPIVRGHVQPNVKNTQPNVLFALRKRNANTPAFSIEMDEERMARNAFAAYLTVFCKEGTQEVLDSLPYIGPDKDAVREWVTRLPDSKRERLRAQEGFSVDDIDLRNNTMNLKAKLKQELGPAYLTSLKAPQSIQYDATGKSTATLSPIIGRKVEVEQSVLKHNMLIVQRKSIEQIMIFLNKFDWRPDALGRVRSYVEIDYATFDKSQGVQASKLHWHKCARFGVMPEFVKFLEEHNSIRSVSALEAGVKMFLDVQRGSGHPDTLDGNNDVNELALAELLLEIVDTIEFIILQGDDVIIAVRNAKIDASHWESEVSRKFNLTMKLSIQEHGYICSMDICHVQDGKTVLIPDIVKTALKFLAMDKKNEDDFYGQWISFKDSNLYVDDVSVRNYLQIALPKRHQYLMPGMTSEVVSLLCRVISRVRNDFSAFRAMFASEKTLRHY